MAAAFTGQIVVPQTPADPIAGPVTSVGRGFAIKAHPSNTGIIYYGKDVNNTVTLTTGVALAPGEGIVLRVKASLDEIKFLAVEAGDVICWSLVEL